MPINMDEVGFVDDAGVMNRSNFASLAFFFCWAVATPALWAAPPAGDPTERLREAERDPKVMEQAMRTGKRVSSFCAHCHGEGGNSVKTDVPNLAGQNTSYLLDQIRQFSDGRRKNMFMEGLVKALNNDEKVGVALFYASQELAPRPAGNPALVARGKNYYDHVCFSCHGETGHGTDLYARIAGQQIDYLSITLKRYRDGSATRMNPIMAAATKKMSDADLQAVVAYVSSMK
jgi:cytochrome c553